jgi:hypothetical protein
VGVNPHLVEPVCLGMEFIERGFIRHPQKDKDRTRDTDTKPGYIYKGVKTVLQQASEGDYQIVFEHGIKVISVRYLFRRKGYRDQAEIVTC